MDEKLLKSVNRKLRLVNLWLSLYTGITLIGLIFMGFMAFRIITYINNLNNKIDSFNPKANYCQDEEPGLIKDKLCN
jgi:hypothetical protein